MALRSKRARATAGAAIILAGVALAAAAFAASRRESSGEDKNGQVLIGEARSGTVRVELGSAVGEIELTEAASPGRPIVVLDPATAGEILSKGRFRSTTEKDLTLALARELRDELAERGRVRVALSAMTTLPYARPARRNCAATWARRLFIAPYRQCRPIRLREARRSTRFRMLPPTPKRRGSQPGEQGGEGLSSEPDGSVRGMLSDLALREQMNASASLAERLVRKSAGATCCGGAAPFADFRVLRHAEVPQPVRGGLYQQRGRRALLVQPKEAGAIVAALAQAIEADVASRNVR